MEGKGKLNIHFLKLQSEIIANYKEEIKLFAALAKRLGAKSKILSEEEMLDLGLLNAIKDGRNSGYVSKEAIDKKLNQE